MACYLHQIATAVPHRSINLEETLEHFSQLLPDPRTLQRVQRILTATGIRKRHLAVLDLQLDCPPEARFYPPHDVSRTGPLTQKRLEIGDRLAAHLVDRLLGRFTTMEWNRVGRLVTVSCTLAGSPGLERMVLQNRAIPRSVDRWHLGFMGCSGGLAGLRLLCALHESDRPLTDFRTSLVVAVELSSLHVQYSDRVDQLVANALFADGASAILLSSERSSYQVIDCRCVTLDAAADQMVWRVGNYGFELQLAVELPATLASHISHVVVEFLADHKLIVADVGHWVIHPGGPKIVEAVCQALALPTEAGDPSRATLSEFGNMSSPTVFFILQRMMDRGVMGSILLMAFGPGLTIELALLEGSASPMKC